MNRLRSRPLLQWGLAGLIATSLTMFGFYNVAGLPPVAPTTTFALTITGPTSVCLNPHQHYEIDVAVTAQTGTRSRRVPGIGVVADIQPGGAGGSINTSALTGGPLNVAQFSFEPSSKGTAVIIFQAIGRDPRTHQVVQSADHFDLDVVDCRYVLTISGNSIVLPDYNFETATGEGKASINDDGSLTGTGFISMFNAYSFPGYDCTNSWVHEYVGFTISGSAPPGKGTVHFELTFTDFQPIPSLSETVDHGRLEQQNRAEVPDLDGHTRLSANQEL